MSLGLICLLLCAASTSGESASATPQHLELGLSDHNGFVYFWSVKVIPSGEVTRVGDAPLGPRHLPPEARQRLRALLAEQQFFSLQQEYGECVIDGRERRISATLNGRRHEVLLCDLPSKGRPGTDVRALLRVWYGALRVLADGVRVENNDARFLESKP